MKAPTGEHWVHTIKHDGFRIIAGRIGGDVRLFSKQGGNYPKRYPIIENEEPGTSGAMQRVQKAFARERARG